MQCLIRVLQIWTLYLSPYCWYAWDPFHGFFFYIQWQNDHDVSILYLIYRWITAIWFLAVLSCSLLDIGRGDEPRFDNHYAKWWIDLTNWGLVVCSVQAWLGAMIVTQGLMVDRDAYGSYLNLNILRSCNAKAKNEMFHSMIFDMMIQSHFRNATQGEEGLAATCLLDFKHHCHCILIYCNILLLDYAPRSR